MNMKINDININYEILGEGYPMLILHGWGGCINSMLPIINTYKEKYKIITLDFPGHGKSDIVDGWNVKDYTNLIYSFLQNLNISELIVVGHSFGGRVGILLSATYPNLVKKLILIDSGGLIPKHSIKYYVRLYTYKVGKQLMKLFIPNKEKYNTWLENERKKRGSNDYNSLIPEMRSTFIKVVNQNLKPYLSKIKCPTLLIWGEFDKDTPPYMGKIMNKHIQNSKLFIFENCGHFSYLDNFVDFKKQADIFLND